MSLYPWQISLWNQLIKRQANNSLPHALLLSGIEGLGQDKFAYAFARQLITQHSADQEALFDSGNHPDFFVLEPEEGSQSIKIDQVRDLQTKLMQTAYANNNYRVVIINPAHKLNTAASNALLKLVEEPNDKILILFITSQSHCLPATLLSRCQKLNFKLDDYGIGLKWVEQNLNNNAINASYLLELAESAPLKALELSETEVQKLYADLLIDIAHLLELKLNPIELAEKWAKQDINQILPVCLNLLTQVICLYHCVINMQSFPNHYIIGLEQWKKQLTLNKLFFLLSKIYQMRKSLFEVASLNSQTLLEDLFISFLKDEKL